MYLKTIEISNFRNIEKINLDFNKNINIFIGKNAQGKTSILESIYVLGFTKSCKNSNEDDLIKYGKLFFKVKGSFKVGNLSKKMEINYRRGEKKLKINSNQVNKVADYVSNLNLIVFSPDDLDIVKKAPAFRRSFLNIELCQLYKEYLVVLNEYNKVLKMRNDYLRKNYRKIDYNYLDIITETLIDRLVIIYKYRDSFVNSVNKYIGDVFYKITKEKGLCIRYNPSVSLKDKKDIALFYRNNYNNDVENGSTMYGPHRDDFSFYLNDIDLKLYGSQGMQRLSILALKFSEISLFKEIKGYYPIVLLDDIFSEIDLDKRHNLLKFIKSNIQFVITTTDLSNISEKILDRASIFTVEDGFIKKRRDKGER